MDQLGDAQDPRPESLQAAGAAVCGAAHGPENPSPTTVAEFRRSEWTVRSRAPPSPAGEAITQGRQERTRASRQIAKYARSRC